MLDVIKAVPTGSVTVKHRVETALQLTPKVAKHRATKLGQRNPKTQRICRKPRATKQCHNQLYLCLQVQTAISQTVKMQQGLMKVAVMRAEPIPTRIAHTEVVAEVANLLGAKNKHRLF